ncbi:pilus assembly protein TadG-related protein [Nocardioides cynanchi]|uniref:pilus assembly protein TadG-related protein n=1 Tax=Nocardioides cynanchi TaxID=2558918 RepID=UPI001786CD72|nr:TadE/TadG family type IV pilus assembly protein [Nocardioides cynanchi]
MIRIQKRDDRGAVAVMVGLCTVLLLTMAALGTDLGQAWAAKRQVQSNADLATLAGAGISGNDLPAPSAGKVCGYGTGALATDPAAIDVARYVASKAYSPNLAPTAVPAATVTATATTLTDCNVGNGEIFYGQASYTKATNTWTLAYNKNQLSLVSPPTKVSFGFAGLLGVNSVDVIGQSTVEIRSPKFSALPFYAFNGCDYGPQTLQQPNNGHSAAAVMLYKPSDNANATLTSITPTSYPVDTTGTVTEKLVISGSGFTNVTQVGFFESGNGVDGPPPVTIDNSVSVKFTISPDGKTITIPDLPDQTRGVSGVQEFWYIRVMIGGKWSTYSVDNNGNVVNAPMLTIGDPPLLCGQGSSSGNFGTLLLSNHVGGGADKEGAANVAIGLDSSLAVYPGPAGDGTCTNAPPSVIWTASGTNCVSTDTGMSANVASGGFLGLGSSAVGGNQYLMYPNGKTKCANYDAGSGTYSTEATTSIKGKLVNNDTLSCFFISPTTHISDVDQDPATGGYTGSVPLISPSIYDSPRFGYVPVLRTQPTNGKSTMYQIVDFRAAFITDQPPSAVKGDPAQTATNGFIMDNNGVNSVQVIFLNPNALPSPPVKNGTINYTGSGPKIPIMVN